MNLSNGIEYLAIPGPSVIPEKVLQAMHRSSPNIYEGELVKLTDNIVPKLCKVARTEGMWQCILLMVMALGRQL